MNRRPRIGLISLQNTLIDFGLRYVAASCRRSGMEVEVLFCPGEPERPEKSPDLLSISSWVREGHFDIVGFSLMAVHVGRAIRIVEAIRKVSDAAIVWGGVHAILKPEKCLEIADFICVGDGEDALPMLAGAVCNGTKEPVIENIWYRKNGEIQQTAPELQADLNSLPFPDYDLAHHWIFHHSKVLQLNEELMRQYMPFNLGRHYVISSRGCPYNCSYCCNAALRRILGKQLSLRFRSVENMMSEIQSIIDRFPYLNQFAIMDDSFFFKPDGWVEDFCRDFKKTGAKFGVLVHPKSVDRDQIDLMINSGLIGVQLGLQSGSERISRGVFRRPETIPEFVKAARILDEFADRLMARTYDIIVDNPYETEEDQAETVRILASLKKPFNIDIFSLTLYPGTELFDRAVTEGKIPPEDQQFENKNFIRIKPTMMNQLIWLTHSTPPPIVLFFLDNRHVLWVKILFKTYFYLWEKGLRVFLRITKRKILHWLASARH